MSELNWTDTQTLTSVRSDGAKVGAFWMPCGDGLRVEWWGYPRIGSPTGPHATCEAAKLAIESMLPFEDCEE